MFYSLSKFEAPVERGFEFFQSNCILKYRYYKSFIRDLQQAIQANKILNEVYHPGIIIAGLGSGFLLNDAICGTAIASIYSLQ